MLEKTHVQNWGYFLPLKIWAETTHFPRFSTISQFNGNFDADCLRNETWSTQSENSGGNYKGSVRVPKRTEKWDPNIHLLHSLHLYRIVSHWAAWRNKVVVAYWKTLRHWAFYVFQPSAAWTLARKWSSADIGAQTAMSRRAEQAAASALLLHNRETCVNLIIPSTLRRLYRVRNLSVSLRVSLLPFLSRYDSASNIELCTTV